MLTQELRTSLGSYLLQVNVNALARMSALNIRGSPKPVSDFCSKCTFFILNFDIY